MSKRDVEIAQVESEAARDVPLPADVKGRRCGRSVVQSVRLPEATWPEADLASVSTICGLGGYGVWVTAAPAPEPRRGRRGPSFAAASPAEIRAALILEEAAEFDQQWREVMARATETLDLSEVLETLESWRRVARLTVASGAEAHRAMYRRAAGRLAGEGISANEPLSRTKARLGL